MTSGVIFAFGEELTPQPTLNNEAEHLGGFKVGIDGAIRITQEVTVPGRVEGFSNMTELGLKHKQALLST